MRYILENHQLSLEDLPAWDVPEEADTCARFEAKLCRDFLRFLLPPEHHPWEDSHLDGGEEDIVSEALPDSGLTTSAVEASIIGDMDTGTDDRAPLEPRPREGGYDSELVGLCLSLYPGMRAAPHEAPALMWKPCLCFLRFFRTARRHTIGAPPLWWTSVHQSIIKEASCRTDSSLYLSPWALTFYFLID